MRVVALTGSVAAGKSSVAALFRAWGADVIDMDAEVRALQLPGTDTFRAIVARFGTAVVSRDGSLDRGALRHLILADATARRDLEAIIHPAVEVRRRALVADAQQRGESLIVIEIPLLFEAADPSAYDAIIVVDAPIDERRRRLVDDRHLTQDDADRLIAAQLPSASKRARATWLIDNDGDRARLEERTRAVWDALHA